MPRTDDYLRRPLVERLERMARTPDELVALLTGHDDATLSRRPGPTSWSAKEVLCHLRDIEEVFMLRFHTMLGSDDPHFLILGEMPPDMERWGIGGRFATGMPLDPDRWAEDRQYARQDAAKALESLRRRRRELLIFLAALTPAEWQRSSVHVNRGRMTCTDWTALIAAHDDDHLAQLRRALDGCP